MATAQAITRSIPTLDHQLQPHDSKVKTTRAPSVTSIEAFSQPPGMSATVMGYMIRNSFVLDLYDDINEYTALIDRRRPPVISERIEHLKRRSTANRNVFFINVTSACVTPHSSTLGVPDVMATASQIPRIAHAYISMDLRMGF